MKTTFDEVAFPKLKSEYSANLKLTPRTEVNYKYYALMELVRKDEKR